MEAQTKEEWEALGYKIIDGEMSLSRNSDNECLWEADQVCLIVNETSK